MRMHRELGRVFYALNEIGRPAIVPLLIDSQPGIHCPADSNSLSALRLSGYLKERIFFFPISVPFELSIVGSIQLSVIAQKNVAIEPEKEP